ncbi:MAG: hypothetical protein ACRDBX_03805 [Erysipelotrichaceae bacterium]
MYHIFHEPMFNATYQIFVSEHSSLKTALEHKERDDLVALGYLYQMEHSEQMSSAQLVERILEAATSRIHLLALCITSTQRQFEMLQKSVNAAHVRPERMEYHYLMRLFTLSLIYTVQEEGVFYLRLFDEVKTAIAQWQPQDRDQIPQSRRVIETVSAALHLYGVLPHDTMRTLLYEYGGFAIAKPEYMELLDLCIMKGLPWEYNRALVGLDTIATHMPLADYFSKQELLKVEYYHPDAALFYAYTDPLFFEEEDALQEAVVLVATSFQVEHSYAHMFVRDACLNFINEDSHHPLLELCTLYHFGFGDRGQSNEFVATMDYYFQFVKSRKLKGYSLYELNQRSLYSQTLS